MYIRIIIAENTFTTSTGDNAFPPWTAVNATAVHNQKIPDSRKLILSVCRWDHKLFSW